jgi:hypothetical protein
MVCCAAVDGQSLSMGPVDVDGLVLAYDPTVYAKSAINII